MKKEDRRRHAEKLEQRRCKRDLIAFAEVRKRWREDESDEEKERRERGEREFSWV